MRRKDLKISAFNFFRKTSAHMIYIGGKAGVCDDALFESFDLISMRSKSCCKCRGEMLRKISHAKCDFNTVVQEISFD
jgi:hypothetical protein